MGREKKWRSPDESVAWHKVAAPGDLIVGHLRVEIGVMRNQGFDQAQSLRGGIEAWSAEVDTSIPRY